VTKAKHQLCCLCGLDFRAPAAGKFGVLLANLNGVIGHCQIVRRMPRCNKAQHVLTALSPALSAYLQPQPGTMGPLMPMHSGVATTRHYSNIPWRVVARRLYPVCRVYHERHPPSAIKDQGLG
jgi:hypothetical protein